MNRRTLLVIASLCCTTFLTQAQKYDIKWGPTYELETSFEHGFKLLGLIGDYYYVIDNRLEINKLLQFNLQHELVAEKVLDFKHKGQHLFLKNLLQTASGTYACFFQYDKDTNRLTTLKSTFKDGAFGPLVETGQFPFSAGILHSSKAERRVELQFLGAVSADGFKAPPNVAYGISSTTNTARNIDNSRYVGNNPITTTELNLNFSRYDGIKKEAPTMSRDKKRVGQVLRTIDVEKKGGKKTSGQAFLLRVMDDQLNLMWRKNWISPESSGIELVDRVLTNDGTLYVLVRMSDYWNNFLPNKRYTLYRFSKEGEGVIELNLADEDLGITTVGLHVQEQTNNHKLFVAGMYKKDIRNSGEQGVFSIILGPQLDQIALKLHPFDRTILSIYNKKKNIDKGRGLGDGYIFDIKYFFQWEDQSISFVSGFITGDYMIPRFDQNGNLIKIQTLERYFLAKRHMLMYRHDLACINKADQLYLLFNDHLYDEEKDNIEPKASEDFADLVILNKNLEVSYREMIYRVPTKEPLSYIPTFYAYADDRILVLRTDGMRKYRFGIIALE